MANVCKTTLTLLLILTSGGVYAQSPPITPEAVQRLVDAGYRPKDPSSMIDALRDPDAGIAGHAAMMLTTFPSNPAAVNALRIASRGSEESLALSAMNALQLLGASGWEADALTRLAEMGPTLRRVALAGILARAGHGDGWIFVRRALRAVGEPGDYGRGASGSLIAIAVENAAYFDGLKDLDDRIIDVEAELVDARPIATSKAPEAVRRIDAEVAKVKAKRKKQN